MKLIKFILWPILLLCLAWTGAIFFGPSLIAGSASYFSEGKVILTRVKVSPKLVISASTVKFELPSESHGKNVRGNSRALMIDWKIRNGFELFVNIGPSTLEKHGTLSSAKVTLKPTSIFNWSEANLKIKFEQLEGPSFDLKQGSLSGELVNSFQDIKDVELVLPESRLLIEGTPLTATESNIKVDYYELKKLLNQQNLKVEYLSKNIKFSEGLFEISSVEGDMMLSNGAVVFNSLGTNAKLGKQGLQAETLSWTSRHLLSAGAFGGTWEFSFFDIVSKVPISKVAKYSGKLTFTNSRIEHRGRALISDLELKTDQYFLGQIKDAVLDVDIDSHSLPSRTDVDGNAMLSFNRIDDLSAKISIGLSFFASGLFNCFDFKCGVEAVNADYEVLASGASLSGNLKCEKTGCFGRPSRHVLQIDHTNRFFKALSNSGILNPLTIPIAYLAISGGQAVGDGHILNF